jgi:hypothetical protein
MPDALHFIPLSVVAELIHYLIASAGACFFFLASGFISDQSKAATHNVERN